MIFLALTSNGVNSNRALSDHSKNALWISAEVLSEVELLTLRNTGADVSEFNYTIELGDHDAKACALETIKEHHPDQVVWIES